MNGIILLNKPSGMTSHDCVDRIRKIFSTKRVGHTGTLDPETTGVLPICLNKATKVVSYLTEFDKEYICKIRIGYSTDTEDFTGSTLESKDVSVDSIKNIDSILRKLLSIEEQIPPMYSAVKVNGKKLYEYAREGKKVKRSPRKIKIYKVERLSEITYNDNCAEFDFKISGSKGFYVRTICVTIGEMLGYPAHLADLKRTKAGKFDVSNSYSFEDIESGNYNLISIIDALDYPKIEVDEYLFYRIMNGSVIKNIYNITSTIMFCRNNEALALYAPHPTKEGMVKPIKVF
ncbi:tRNA pseudouridine(55) synthase TruB [Mycoplasmatota bacterium zrk1]